MNFDLSDDQQHIRTAVRDFAAARFDSAKVRRHAEAGSVDEAAWRELCGLGWAGVAVPEAYGGQGLGMVELCVIAAELGRTLAPVPFLGNAAAALALQVLGDAQQQEATLPGLSSGAQRGTVASSRATLVPDVAGAALCVLAGEEDTALVTDPRFEPAETLDSTRRFGRLQGSSGSALHGDTAAALDRVEVVLSAELLGVAERAMEMAVEHARTRTQFDRPIGAYQAVSHRCAQMLIEVKSARSAVYSAAWTADHEPERLPFAASVAKVAAAGAAWHTCTSALQVLGGIGFTWEHDLHLYLRRAQVDGHLFGSTRAHRERIASLSGLPELVPVAQG